MNFIKFAFSFLYVRNWNTGVRELSRLRLAIFCGGLFLVLLALTIVAVLSAPSEYHATTEVVSLGL